MNDQIRSTRPTEALPLLPPHLYSIPGTAASTSSQERSGRDPGLRSKTKRLSKTLPSSPITKQRHRPPKSHTSNKRDLEATSLATELPLPPAPVSALPTPQRRQQPVQLPPPLNLSKDCRPPIDIQPESVAYSPPTSKKGIFIDRPYSFYKVAPKTPQSVTAIDSPFGDPSPVSPIPQTQPWSAAYHNIGSNYQTHPSQSNPFIPPKQFQPFQSSYQSRQQQQEQNHPHQHQSTSRGDSSRKDRPDPEDSIPATTRSHSIGGGGKLQSRQQYEQEQLQHQQQANHTKAEVQVEAAPVRKNSGKNLLRMARQASDSAFRSVGLNRKSSAKKEAQAASALQAKEVEAIPTHNSSSHSRSQQGQQPVHPQH
ncbi:hypothetical protein BGZ95_001114, partial [Linnemannia exigua]